jgi:hypothetical protein
VQSYFNVTEDPQRLIVDLAGLPNPPTDVPALKVLLEDSLKSDGTCTWQKVRGPTNVLQGIVPLPIGTPLRTRKKKRHRGKNVIRNMANLCDYFGATHPFNINRCTYKYSSCGHSLSVRMPDGEWVHNGDKDWDDMTRETKIIAFSVQTIVEGSEMEVNMDPFELPVTHREVARAIKDMEAQADSEWRRMNHDHYCATDPVTGYGCYLEVGENEEEFKSEVPSDVYDAFMLWLKTDTYVEENEKFTLSTAPGWTFERYLPEACF